METLCTIEENEKCRMLNDPLSYPSKSLADKIMVFKKQKQQHASFAVHCGEKKVIIAKWILIIIYKSKKAEKVKIWCL